MEAEVRHVDLSKETLHMVSCGECRALVMTEHHAEHIAWHARHPEPRDG